MNKGSYFIKNKALFGSFPTQEEVLELEQLGVICFVDLTDHDETKTTPYKTKVTYIKYPITDCKIPTNWKSFAQLIVRICNIIKTLEENQKIYIHCKGGHGRSGVLVACVLCYYYHISAEEAISLTTMYHAQRPLIREKWKRLGSPQGLNQKRFVHNFFFVLKYGTADSSNYKHGFDNSSRHSVTTELGCFPNAHFAFQAYKAPTNEKYIESLKKGEFMDVETPSNWNEKKLEYMMHVLYNKFTQHEQLKENLMNTGLRPLIKISNESFWGETNYGKGANMHGKLLQDLRVSFLEKEVQEFF